MDTTLTDWYLFEKRRNQHCIETVRERSTSRTATATVNPGAQEGCGRVLDAHCAGTTVGESRGGAFAAEMQEITIENKLKLRVVLSGRDEH